MQALLQVSRDHTEGMIRNVLSPCGYTHVEYELRWSVPSKEVFVVLPFGVLIGSNDVGAKLPKEPKIWVYYCHCHRRYPPSYRVPFAR